MLLSVMVPVVTVTILTFTYFKKGQRRSLWAGFGLRRAGFKSWAPALFFALPAVRGGVRNCGADRRRPPDRDFDITAVGAVSWTLNLVSAWWSPRWSSWARRSAGAGSCCPACRS